MILGQSAIGQMTHFSVTGFASVACALLCIYLSGFLGTRQQSSKMETVAKIERRDEVPATADG
jgi:hypothetical protein